MDYAQGAPAASDREGKETASAGLAGFVEAPAHSSGWNDAQQKNPSSFDLLSSLQQFYFNIANYPSEVVSEAASIGLLSGICGRAYNTPTGAGVNQFILLLAESGGGKDIVAGGTSKLTTAIQPSCPAIIDFRGPGELISSAGLIKWLSKKSPCIYSIVGEIGKLLEMMVKPNASQHLKGINRTILQLYSKSGEGEVFDPMAYADTEKNTAAILSPSLTLFGECVPSTFYETLDEGMATDGWLPRFLTFEEKGKRPYRQETADTYIADRGLITELSDLAAHCLGLMHRRQVHRIDWTPEAKATFRQFDRWTTDAINEATGQAPRELYNRANLKALKLASVRAIGENYLNPVITVDHAMWATKLVVDQTQKLIAKFASGAIGAEANNENKQLAHMMRVIAELFERFTAKGEAIYGVEPKMLADAVFPHSYLQRRLFTLPAFKPRPKQAINDTVKLLLENDWLRQVPTQQLALRYDGKKPKSYVIANVQAFAPYWPAGFSDNFRGELRW